MLKICIKIILDLVEIEGPW